MTLGKSQDIIFDSFIVCWDIVGSLLLKLVAYKLDIACGAHHLISNATESFRD